MSESSTVHFLSFNDVIYDQRMQRIWKTLHDHGFDIKIIAVKRNNAGSSLNGVKRIQLFFKKGILAYLEFNLRAIFLLMFQPIGIISVVDLDTMFAGWFISKVKRSVLVYDAHEYFAELPELSNKPLKKRIWNRLAIITVPSAQQCYTIGSYFAELMQEAYHNRFQVIRNLPWYDYQSIDSWSQERTFIYQGVLNVGRGLESFLESMTLVPEVKLILAGDGDIKMELLSKIANLGLESRVKFLGTLTPELLKQLTPKCFAGLNLLEPIGLNYYYSLANKFFDYIQAGIPQICIGFPEYVVVNDEYQIAVLTPDLQAKHLVNAIQEISNQENYHRLKSNTKRAAKELCWEAEAEKLAAIYINLKST